MTTSQCYTKLLHVDVGVLLLWRKTSVTGKQFSSYLRTNILVAPLSDGFQEEVSLIFSDIVLISLSKGQESLVPDNWQWSSLGLGGIFIHGIFLNDTESHKVVNQVVNNLVWQGVFLFQEDSDEDCGGWGEFHLQ
ncbi:hypothetical protein WICPIJ_005590 [Wickerhamomyces pijperi]|uniref:Uncharacterized protein n=1 Tax=Wickerhamomyces pijperi TaxID=599730 RepID=A0A9P8TKZ2_WICPI|nr:hypothetical protein WICPIJ_005590 [Wickerhamomyces pijperi]